MRSHKLCKPKKLWLKLRRWHLLKRKMRPNKKSKKKFHLKKMKLQKNCPKKSPKNLNKLMILNLKKLKSKSSLLIIKKKFKLSH